MNEDDDFIEWNKEWDRDMQELFESVLPMILELAKKHDKFSGYNGIVDTLMNKLLVHDPDQMRIIPAGWIPDVIISDGHVYRRYDS